MCKLELNIIRDFTKTYWQSRKKAGLELIAALFAIPFCHQYVSHHSYDHHAPHHHGALYAFCLHLHK
jgi:hypothetical protein